MYHGDFFKIYFYAQMCWKNKRPFWQDAVSVFCSTSVCFLCVDVLCVHAGRGVFLASSLFALLFLIMASSDKLNYGLFMTCFHAWSGNVDQLLWYVLMPTSCLFLLVCLFVLLMHSHPLLLFTLPFSETPLCFGCWGHQSNYWVYENMPAFMHPCSRIIKICCCW